MKKRYINLILALTVVLAGFAGTHIDANAETESIDWAVTYTGSDFDSTYKAEKSKLTNVMPGDTVEFSVDYKKGTDSDANFYMSADVLKTLEDGATDLGGAYSYKILSSNSDQPIFDSETIGGDNTDVIGLDQVNSGDGAYFSLGTLGSGNQGTVTISIALDGNSQSNDYMSKLAELEIKFAAEPTSDDLDNQIQYKTKTKINSIVNKIFNRDKQTVVKQVARTLDDGTQIVIIDEDTVPTSGTTVISGNPRTGDSIMPLLVCGVAMLLGIALIVYYFIMTRDKKEEVA